MTLKIRATLSIIALVFALCTLSQTASAKTSLYNDEHISITVDIDAKAYVQDMYDSSLLTDKQKDELKGTLHQSLVLLTAFKANPATATGVNPSIVIVLESPPESANIESPGDYINMLKTSLSAQSAEYKYSSADVTELSKIKLEGFGAKINVQGREVKQQYLASKLSDKILSIALTYQTDADKSWVIKQLSTLKLVVK